MRHLKVTPSSIHGEITLPPCKSHTMRALIFAAMAEGKSTIHHYLHSPDVFAMIEALRGLGVSIVREEKRLFIEGKAGKLLPCKNVIDAGNSGQLLRFIGALAALLPTYTVITGDDSILQRRPVAPLLSAIVQLGGFAVSSTLNDRAPIIIKGPIRPGYARFSGEDSQPVSGLLMATAFLPGKSILCIDNPQETPWIDLTLYWLKKLGSIIEHEDYRLYTVSGNLAYRGFEVTIPSDFSSLAFPLVASVITGSSTTFRNIDMDDVQGDKRIVTLLQEMGAIIEIDKERKTLKTFPSKLRGIDIDMSFIIDAIPVLSVLGCFAEGKTRLYNARIARKKESDRLSAITKELKKMGAIIEEKEEELIISTSPLKGAKLESHSDHRIAMAVSIASLAAKGPSWVEGVACIDKSYPTFIRDFQKLGALWEEENGQ